MCGSEADGTPLEFPSGGVHIGRGASQGVPGERGGSHTTRRSERIGWDSVGCPAGGVWGATGGGWREGQSSGPGDELIQPGRGSTPAIIFANHNFRPHFLLRFLAIPILVGQLSRLQNRGRDWILWNLGSKLRKKNNIFSNRNFEIGFGSIFWLDGWFASQNFHGGGKIY